MRRAVALGVLALAVACGKTVFTNERFACAASGDCADGFECTGGECKPAGTTTEPDAGADDGGEREDAGPADAGPEPTDGGAGATCATQAACAAGLTCVDGVCCRSACGAPCDSCNQAGQLGTCLPRPAGASAASCNGYACDGTSTTCATSCQADAGVNACGPGFTCIAATCGRCWSAVTDDFTSASAWNLSGASVTGGRLVVSVLSRNGQPSTSSATSLDTLPLTGCGVTFSLAVPPTPAAGYEGRAELRADTTSRVPAFGWRMDTRGLLAEWRLSDGGVGEQVLVPAGTAPPKWLRLEESNGQVRWRTTNAGTFNTVHTVTHAESLTGLKLEFSGSYPAQPGSDRTSYEIDSLNLGP